MKKIFWLMAPLLFVVVALSMQSFNFAQTAAPKLFAEGIINSAGDDYNPTFAPDGKTVYFARRQDRKGNETVMFSIWENGNWTAPKAAAFSVGKDKEPMLAPDGKRLFFASTRPNGRDARGNYDIWFVERTAAGWSEPQNVGEVNSAGYDNYPSVASDGTLYFASVRIDNRKDNDLYRSRLVNGKYQAPENLGNIINTEATEADPFVAPDQSYIIFSSDRDGGAGEGDLYVSFNQNGKWTAPQSLGANLNTADYEYTPLVFKDKFYFSRGWGDVYEIDVAALNLSALKQNANQKVETPKTDLTIYAGVYEIAPNLVLTVTAENGQLFGAAKGRKNELKWIGENRFAVEDKASIAFVKDASGKIAHLILTEGGQTMQAKKIK